MKLRWTISPPTSDCRSTRTSSFARIIVLIGIATAHSSVQHAVIDFHQALRKHEAVETDAETDAMSANHLQQDETSPQSVQAVFTQALGVGTWFKIADDTQEMLLKAGQNAIYRHDGATGAGGKKLLPEMQRIRGLF